MNLNIKLLIEGYNEDWITDYSDDSRYLLSVINQRDCPEKDNGGDSGDLVSRNIV